MKEKPEQSTIIYSAIFPLRQVRRDIFPWMDRFEELVESLAGCEFLSPDMLKYPPISWSIYKTSINAELIEVLSTENLWENFPVNNIVRVDFQVQIPTLDQLKKDIHSNYDMPDGEYLPMWSAVMAHKIKDEIAIIMMAMDISDPDSAFRGQYLLTEQGRWRWNSSGTAHFDEAYEFARELELPRSPKIDFKRAWNYLKSTPGLREGVGSSPASKLPVALTYLYAVSSQSARFFWIVWCCYGLEGFYAQGADSRGRQVAQRLALFLRLNAEVCETELAKLYKSRSSFVHGNKALSSARIEIEPPDGKISTEEWDSEYIGSYFLLETLRECVRQNISEQKFVLTLARS